MIDLQTTMLGEAQEAADAAAWAEIDEIGQAVDHGGTGPLPEQVKRALAEYAERLDRASAELAAVFPPRD